MSSLTLNANRKPLYPGGDQNYRKNAAEYYANREQIRYDKQYSSSFAFQNYYDDEDVDGIRVVKFKTPKHEWEEEWYQSDIDFMSSPQAWTRYIKLRDLQMFYENDKNEIHNYQKWNEIQYLIEEHPFIFEDNKYGYEFGELVYNNDNDIPDYMYYSDNDNYHYENNYYSDSDDQNDYQSNNYDSNDNKNTEYIDDDDYYSDYY